MPTVTNFNRYSAFQFARRKQPWDSVCPTCFRAGCAVNAVTRFVEPYPGNAHGIIRPGTSKERLH